MQWLPPFSETATEPTTSRSTFTVASRPTGTLNSFTPCTQRWYRQPQMHGNVFNECNACNDHAPPLAPTKTSLLELTWDVEQTRSCSLLAPCGGVILLKRPVRRRGVGTNSVFFALKETQRQACAGELSVATYSYLTKQRIVKM